MRSSQIVQQLQERFVRLCEVSSPTGEERAIADAVAAELTELGADVTEDQAAGPARAGAGNLLARVPGRGEGWLMFSAHLDTVPHEGQIEVVLDEGVYRSAGETILGADNKAAVAVLMELAARRVANPAQCGIELLLTVAEEEGLRGAKAFDLSSLRATSGFVLDHATPIGEVVTASPTHQRITADFTGVEAHAGLRPEAGRSAIAAAAAAIGAMELGRLDEETTANVGLIHGGSATNVVPRSCRVQGEARSVEANRAAEVIGAMSEACMWGASEHGCDADVRIEEEFRGYRTPPDSRALAIAEAALRRAGIEPTRVATGGGSDANAHMAAGFDCLLLANGTEANHTPEERVSARNLERMLEVCEAIVEEAGC
jgi:tripeptide aminopeptidase